MLAAWLHESLRWPMKVPGRHGLEWLALLVAARALSTRPAAAMTVALGAAVATVIGGHASLDAQLRPVIYLLQGAAIDGLWRAAHGRLGDGSGWLLPWAMVAGATAHALSPLAKTLVVAAGADGAHFGSLARGLGYPLGTHLVFGAAGAAAGAIAALAWHRRRRRR